MKTILAFASLFTLATLPHAHGVLLAYWNMDANTVSGKLTPNSGSQAGSISTEIINIEVGFDGGIDPLASGTTDNIIGTSGTNRALGFYRVGSVYSAGSFRMSGFNFTNLENVSISFAVQGENTFTWDTNLEVDYRINNGSWVDISEGISYSANWNTAAISFGTALNNLSDVDLRIRTDSWLSGYGYLDIDNVQVNAIPEPATVASLLGLGSLVFAALWRHRKTSHQPTHGTR